MLRESCERLSSRRSLKLCASVFLLSSIRFFLLSLSLSLSLSHSSPPSFLSPPPLLPLPPSLSPSLPPSLSPSLPPSLSPSLPPSLSPSLAPSLSPSLPVTISPSPSHFPLSLFSPLPRPSDLLPGSAIPRCTVGCCGSHTCFSFPTFRAIPEVFNQCPLPSISRLPQFILPAARQSPGARVAAVAGVRAADARGAHHGASSADRHAQVVRHSLGHSGALLRLLAPSHLPRSLAPPSLPRTYCFWVDSKPASVGDARDNPVPYRRGEVQSKGRPVLFTPLAFSPSPLVSPSHPPRFSAAADGDARDNRVLPRRGEVWSQGCLVSLESIHPPPFPPSPLPPHPPPLRISPAAAGGDARDNRVLYRRGEVGRGVRLVTLHSTHFLTLLLHLTPLLLIYLSQLLAVMLAIIGFFIGVGKFGAEAATESRHARMGIAVFTFTLAQPLLGVIRPHKGNKIRVAWYFAHWLLGILAVGMGWYVLFLGLGLYEHETDQDVQRDHITAALSLSAAGSMGPSDGLTLFPSVTHVSSLLHLGGRGSLLIKGFLLPSLLPVSPPTPSPPPFPPPLSPSLSPPLSPSLSPPLSPSLSPPLSPSLSPPLSPSLSPPLSPSLSPPLSPSLSPPLSPSLSPPLSPSLSPPLSPSLSPPLSPSLSPPLSPSLSPPLSPSLSPPLSPSLSPPLSPSLSPPLSPSLSPPLSPSLSPPLSPSLSPPLSPLPFPPTLPLPFPPTLPLPFPPTLPLPSPPTLPLPSPPTLPLPFPPTLPLPFPPTLPLPFPPTLPLPFPPTLPLPFPPTLPLPFPPTLPLPFPPTLPLPFPPTLPLPFPPTLPLPFPSPLATTQGYKIALGVTTSLMLFAFLLLGRWDHLVGQADSASKVDGLTRFPSVAHVSSLLHLGGGKASEERIAAERGVAEERAAALGGV
ncbi:unnamed protein product [Closterium sp. Naga37s-1]|nr:unnamed protein product [Closterium sp. Naga37s-1]